MKNLTYIGVIALIVFVIFVIVFWPFVLIWALNTVFISLSIPYTSWTWLSIWILQASTFGGIKAAIRNK